MDSEMHLNMAAADPLDLRSPELPMKVVRDGSKTAQDKPRRTQNRPDMTQIALLSVVPSWLETHLRWLTIVPRRANAPPKWLKVV